MIAGDIGRAAMDIQHQGGGIGVHDGAQPAERGLLLGVFQSVGGLGRVFGPMYAGVAFAQLGAGSPYLIGALLMLPCVLLSVAVIRRPAPA